ncbi:MAG: A/G-specific adenine glycosylase [Bacteroidota bacterium]
MKAVLPIVNWYREHKRDLPWRNTRNPYLIWLSEVILQQTRVEQGLPYYLKFADKYPTVKKLAAAKDDDVMKLWQGLGYYNRAKNMLQTARIVAKDCNGVFPDTHDGLIELKGIGPYTAAAIASFAFDEPKAVVDGNVYRVLARVFGISEPINGTKGKKLFAELAQEIMDTRSPALYNQAVMELGAIVCKPAAPKCGECVLRLQCEAYKHKRITELPVKLKKQKPKERFLHFFFINHNGKTYIKQRVNERIWHNLFEPPFIETPTELDNGTLFSLPAYRNLFSGKHTADKVFAVKHQLTHQTIYANFWAVQVPNSFKPSDSSYIAVPVSEIHQYAVHRLFDKFLNYHTLQGK